MFASSIPEIIELVGSGSKYGGELKREHGKRYKKHRILVHQQSIIISVNFCLFLILKSSWDYVYPWEMLIQYVAVQYFFRFISSLPSSSPPKFYFFFNHPAFHRFPVLYFLCYYFMICWSIYVIYYFERKSLRCSCVSLYSLWFFYVLSFIP